MVIKSDKDYLVATLIADWLEYNGIDVVFGIIGSANSYIFDAIATKGFTKIIYMHHEQAVVMAAGAYYRASGKISVAIVTAGAGSANAITGVLSNWADSIPCIVLSGQESTKYIKEHAHLRMLGTQGFNVVKMVQDITKLAKIIDNPNVILKSLDEALSVSMSGRKGPTWLDIPMDIQSFKLNDIELDEFVNEASSNQENDFHEVLSLLETSQRPVILAGHGINLSNSKKAFNNLIEKLQIPVLHSWSATDVMPSDHQLNFGCPGLYGQRCANFIIQNCDLLIVVGSRLALPQTGYNINNFAPHAKIVMVNNDSDELNKHDRYDLKYLCDCKDFISSLNEFDKNFNRESWIERCINYKLNFPIVEDCHFEDNKKYENSYVFINNISKYLDDDHIVVIGQGTPLPCCHQSLIHKKDQTIFASNGLGEMGNGLPSAIGAAIASPNKKIILFDGDGSSMMNLQEMQTLVGYKIPLKIVVFNNNGYLFIKHTQKMLFNGRYTGVNKDTGVSLPDFSKIAYAFGLQYFNNINNDIQAFLECEGSAIFETFMNPEQDLVPKVKGILTSSGILAPPIEEMSPLLNIDVIEESMIQVNDLSYRIRK
jgi:acetolactate synthase-1/2/3 large subunit